jgi:hypothetical protein
MPVTTDHYSRVRTGDQVNINDSLKCHGRPMATSQPTQNGPATHQCVVCGTRVDVDSSGRIGDIRST